MPLAALAEAIGQATGTAFQPDHHTEAGGGCINRGLSLAGRDGRRFFVKLNAARHADMFSAEVEGLTTLAAARAIRVPRPVTHGIAAGQAFLVLEWLDLRPDGDAAGLGRRLAALHRVTWHAHGWHRDNTIGSTPQPNTATPDWIPFYRDRRLGHQIDLAAETGAPARLLDGCRRLQADIEAFFGGYRPLPSLLHGDLWGGNVGYVNGEPVLFDPAVYHGDRETDLAMTELFGGFPASFQAAYREAWPLDPGYATRRLLYNLYHVLNHHHLFGGGYAAQAERMVERLLAEIRA